MYQKEHGRKLQVSTTFSSLTRVTGKAIFLYNKIPLVWTSRLLLLLWKVNLTWLILDGLFSVASLALTKWYTNSPLMGLTLVIFFTHVDGINSNHFVRICEKEPKLGLFILFFYCLRILKIYQWERKAHCNDVLKAMGGTSLTKQVNLCFLHLEL